MLFRNVFNRIRIQANKQRHIHTSISLYGKNKGRKGNTDLERGQKAKRRFIDKVYISCSSGQGGLGCVSFSKSQLTRQGLGPPDGGNGGDGGSVYIESVPNMNVFQNDTIHIKAGRGVNGSKGNCHGKSGEDITIKVPPGTSISEVLEVEEEMGTNKKIRKMKLLVDMDKPNMRECLAKGGKGGLGNKHFRTGETRAPRYSEQGELGEKVNLLLELKTIADVGLVGFPNAGKSSFLTSVSRAKPKIAAYPFTTLEPSVGVVEVNNDLCSIFTVADIPGLVEGAHDDKGLGHEFLKHIERTHVLLYVLDIAGTEGRDPIDDYLQLRTELRYYSEDLYHRPSVIFANKTDMKPRTCEKNLIRLKDVLKETGCGEYSRNYVPVVSGSCLKRKNIDEVIQVLYETMNTYTPK